MEDKQVEEVLLAYRERYLALREDPMIKLIMVFKNHGEAAGTSLSNIGWDNRSSDELGMGQIISPSASFS